jgi:mono/diheme cytochrome c family protein
LKILIYQPAWLLFLLKTYYLLNSISNQNQRDMKKIFVFAAMSIGIMAAFYLTSCKDKKTEVKAASYEDSAKQKVARGEYLANHVAPCLDCHSKRDFSKFAGPIVPGTEGMGGEVFDQKLVGLPGTFYAKNITPDNETGIGTWTDDEILKAITQGISKNGDTLFPIMPYANFNHMAKEDLLSIIAYLRTLKPIKNKVPARQLMLPNISMAYPAAALQRSVDGNKMPPESDAAAYGGYLVNAAVCSDCHTPQTKAGPDFTRMFGGGQTFDLGIFKVTTANISPDSTTGIGAWNEERFMNKFTQYREEKNFNFDPGKQNTIMPVICYAGMKDSDLKSIYAYLRTVKPVKQVIEKYPK